MKIYKIATLLTVSFSTVVYAPAQQISTAGKLLKEEYNVVPRHSKDTMYYEMESRVQKHALDGTPQGWDVYHLYLRCVPSINVGREDEYTCLKFTVHVNNTGEISIPSLANWKYFFSLKEDNKNKEGELFGIDHAKFEMLTDNNNKALSPESGYYVYNAFIDFHTMSVFSEKASKGKGAQDLKHVGDKVIHEASFSQPPVSLGSQVAEGSYFKNGEITLAFKGLSLVNETTCALLEYDSGESSFYIVMTPMANMKIPTKGSSHYWGDIYKNLTSGWIQKANLHEIVISETTVPGMDKIHSVIERSINIEKTAKPEFER